MNALIQRLTVTTSNGTLLMEINDYNRFYNVVKLAFPMDYLRHGDHGVGDSLHHTDEYAYNSGSTMASQRKYFLNGPTAVYSSGTANTNQFSYKLYCPLLDAIPLFPVNLIRGGLHIELTWASVKQAMMVASITTDLSVYEINVINPRLVCEYVQPSDAVMQKYVSAFESEGIHYSFPYVVQGQKQVDLGTSAGGLATTSLYNVRSARAVHSIIQKQLAAVDSAAATPTDEALDTLGYDSTGQFVVGGISDYLYVSGSQRFPENKPVELGTRANSQLVQYFQQAMQGANNPQFSNYSADIDQMRGDSGRVLFSARLGRSDDYFGGLDLSVQPLKFQVSNSAAYAAGRYLTQWVVCDAVLSIANTGVSVRY